MPIEIHKSGGFTVTGEEGIRFYRMAAILQGMKFEHKTGMKLTRGVSCFTIVRREFGLKGNKEKLIEQFEKLVSEQSAKVTRVHDDR